MSAIQEATVESECWPELFWRLTHPTLTVACALRSVVGDEPDNGCKYCFAQWLLLEWSEDNYIMPLKGDDE